MRLELMSLSAVRQPRPGPEELVQVLHVPDMTSRSCQALEARTLQSPTARIVRQQRRLFDWLPSFPSILHLLFSSEERSRGRTAAEQRQGHVGSDPDNSDDDDGRVDIAKC